MAARLVQREIAVGLEFDRFAVDLEGRARRKRLADAGPLAVDSDATLANEILRAATGGDAGGG